MKNKLKLIVVVLLSVFIFTGCLGEETNQTDTDGNIVEDQANDSNGESRDVDYLTVAFRGGSRETEIYFNVPPVRGLTQGLGRVWQYYNMVIFYDRFGDGYEIDGFDLDDFTNDNILELMKERSVYNVSSYFTPGIPESFSINSQETVVINGKEMTKSTGYFDEWERGTHEDRYFVAYSLVYEGFPMFIMGIAHRAEEQDPETIEFVNQTIYDIMHTLRRER